MNAQAPFAKSNDLKICCMLAKVVGFAKTDAKNFLELFDGVGALNTVAAILVRQNNTSSQLGNRYSLQ